MSTLTNQTTPQNCPQCGAPLPAIAKAGLCPHCVMAMNLGPQTELTGEFSSHGTKGLKPEPPLPEDLAGRFPQLHMLGLHGHGGMGAVYKARQKDLDRIVALKILPPGIGKDPSFAERFTREARALAKLNHPHIVTIYEFGQADGLFYFLMEFVDGLNLRQVMEGGRIRPAEALAIVPQICEALQYAHQHGIVHRDIKPANVLLSRDGVVKIADFGVARLVGAQPSPHDGPTDGRSDLLTKAGKTMGTPQYMAPEQMKNPQEVDHRADIYALGVVFYEMLTGELPGKRIELPSRKVQMDVRLDKVVLRALEKEPERRYQDVNQIKTDVETIGIDSSAATRAGGSTPKSLGPVGRAARDVSARSESARSEDENSRTKVTRRWAGVGLATVLLLLGVGGWMAVQERDSEVEVSAAAGLPDGWRQTVEIPSAQPGSVAIPGATVSMWVEAGWLIVRRESAKQELEWQVVFAQPIDTRSPRTAIDERTGGFELSYGGYFIRDSLQDLRILRQRKSDALPAWSHLRPQAAWENQRQFGAASDRGTKIRLEGWALGDWCWVASGLIDKPDVWVRLQHEQLREQSSGFVGGAVPQMHYGDATAQDEGDLFVAKRVPISLAEHLLPARMITTGSTAPPLDAREWFNSEALSLDALHGQVVLLDFWGQWCGPCVANLPSIETLHANYKDRGVVVIGIHSAHSSENLARFLGQKGVSFPIAVDGGTTAARYAIQAWPTYYLVDKSGRIAWGPSNKLPTEQQIEALTDEPAENR